jgi:hypothetical protein
MSGARAITVRILSYTSSILQCDVAEMSHAQHLVMRLYCFQVLWLARVRSPARLDGRVGLFPPFTTADVYAV